MSFCDWRIGSPTHRLALIKHRFARVGRKCNEKSPILFTGRCAASLVQWSVVKCGHGEASILTAWA
jgi:hypothetical protein